jgi:hypothetical protein
MPSILGRPAASVKRTAAVAAARAGPYTEFLRRPGADPRSLPMGLTGIVLAVLVLGLVGAWLARLARN